MTYPAYFRNEQSYACVLSPTDYILVQLLHTSRQIQWGPNANQVGHIVNRYQRSTEEEFNNTFHRFVDQLNQKYEKVSATVHS